MNRMTAVLVLGVFVAGASLARAQASITALGRVVDAEGNPIPDVQVRMEYKGNIPQKYRTSTDKKGVFTHVNVYAGLYKVTLQKEGVGETSFDYNFQELDSLQKPPDFKLLPPRPQAPPPGSGLAPAGEATGAAAGASAAAAPVNFAQLTADMNAAAALSREGKLDEAVAAYEKILATAPTIPLVHYNLAEAQKKKGDLEAAEAGYRKSIELDPKFVDGYVGLATIYAEARRSDEAIAVIEKGVAEDETSGRLRYAQGVLQMNAGRNQEAREAFLKAAELDPENVETQYHLGTIALNMGDKAEAVKRFQTFVDTAPAGTPNVDLAKSLIAALQK
jgi:tetratricopeptide (TPR) repeat protein